MIQATTAGHQTELLRKQFYKSQKLFQNSYFHFIETLNFISVLSGPSKRRICFATFILFLFSRLFHVIHIEWPRSLRPNKLSIMICYPATVAQFANASVSFSIWALSLRTVDQIPLGTSSIAQKPKGFFTIPIVERRSQTMMIKTPQYPHRGINL